MTKQCWLGAIGMIIYSGFIFYLSSVPGSSIHNLPLRDKTLHFFLYLPFGLIITFFLYNLKLELSWVKIVVITFFFTSMYGLSDEIHQLFVPARYFSLSDLLVNLVGGTSGSLLIIFLYKYAHKFWWNSDTNISMKKEHEQRDV